MVVRSGELWRARLEGYPVVEGGDRGFMMSALFGLSPLLYPPVLRSISSPTTGILRPMRLAPSACIYAISRLYCSGRVWRVVAQMLLRSGMPGNWIDNATDYLGLFVCDIEIEFEVL